AGPLTRSATNRAAISATRATTRWPRPSAATPNMSRSRRDIRPALQRAWKKVEEGMVGFVNLKTTTVPEPPPCAFPAAKPEQPPPRRQKEGAPCGAHLWLFLAVIARCFWLLLLAAPGCYFCPSLPKTQGFPRLWLPFLLLSGDFSP